jgi:hypothetical protein
MINGKYEQLSAMTNEDLLQELVHRMENFSKYKLLMEKWNRFESCDGEEFRIKIMRNEVTA